MNSETLLQLVQNGFRLTLGATASLVEVLQDPAKREENLAKLRQEWSHLSETWVTKGATTEAEARTLVETWLNQRRSTTSAPSDTGAAPRPASTVGRPATAQTELQALTAQIAAIRAELEQLRKPQ